MAIEKPGAPRVGRMVYHSAIRETIEPGDLDRMRAVLERAKTLQAEHGGMEEAIARLETAIKDAS